MHSVKVHASEEISCVDNDILIPCVMVAFIFSANVVTAKS